VIDQLDEQNNDPASGIFYNNSRFETLDRFFTRRYGPREERIKKQPSSDKKLHQQHVGNNLKTFRDGLEPEVLGALPSVEDQLESKIKKRDRLKNREGNLLDEKKKHKKKTNKNAAKAYIALYVALVLGSMVFYASTLPVIMPEVPTWAGIIQSLFLAAPSFLAAEFYKRSQYKDKLLRWLIIGGLVASAGLVIFIGIARVTTYNIMSKAASSSFLQTGAASTGLETLQATSVFLVFLFGILTEITFSSCLLIHVKQIYEEQIPTEQVEAELGEIETELRQADEDFLILSQLRAQIIKFPEISQSWCEDKKDELSIWYDEYLQGLSDKARLEFDRKSPTEQVRIVK